jgi:hypothetical protein
VASWCGSRSPYLVGGLKAVVQQPERVQLQQPLAFLNVALAARHVLGVLRVDQENLQPVLLQNFECRHPVHPGRLQRHAADASLHQPARHFPQI